MLRHRIRVQQTGTSQWSTARSTERPAATTSVLFGCAALTLLLSACARVDVTPQPPDSSEPAPPTEATARVDMATVAPGSAIEVRGSGYRANSTVQIGFGLPQSEYDVVRTVRTDAQGEVMTSLTVPNWAGRGRPYVVVINVPDGGTRAVTEPFVVGAPGDTVAVTGRLTDEGVECPALRGVAGELYTLAAQSIDYGAGTEVRVRGTIAGVSTCMQGTTLQVLSIERR